MALSIIPLSIFVKCRTSAHLCPLFPSTTGSQSEPKYVFVPTPLTWSKAQTYCRQNFIDLATFKSDTDYQKIQLSNLNGFIHWIGLFRDPNLHWSDGSGVVFTSWDSVSITIGSMTVMCGVTSSGKSGQWKFLPCESRLPFVCFDRPGECVFKVRRKKIRESEKLYFVSSSYVLIRTILSSLTE